MKVLKNPFIIALAAAAVLTVSASAQLQVGAVGSSAMFQTATIEAYQEALADNPAPACSPNCPGYYTLKNGAQILDNRNASIVPQTGNLAVVWDNPTSPSHVWYYLSVDSVVGNRSYFATPRAKLGNINSTTGTGVIASVFFGNLAPSNIPPNVLTVINNSSFTAAFTDIRPEDALFAELRTDCAASPATLLCLGYGNGTGVGTAIMSGVPGSTSNAQPVDFNIFGTDPFTQQAIPPFQTYPVGVSPIVFIVNRQNASGLGAGGFTNMPFQATPVLMFAGLDMNTTAFGLPVTAQTPQHDVYPVLREPMSGTMNTFEFNVMVPNWFGPASNALVTIADDSVKGMYFSQEGCEYGPPFSFPSTFTAMHQPQNNLLNLAVNANNDCPTVGNGWAYGSGSTANGQGWRIRAIGTSEEVSEVKAQIDGIGYTFFSFGNVSSIAGNPSYGYLAYGEWGGGAGGSLIPTDPIKPIDPNNPTASAQYGPAITVGNVTFNGNGQLPTCTSPCPITPGSSFANVRSGAYQAWSLLRAVGAQGDAALLALTTGIANQVNETSPDFIPFNPTSDGDPGLAFYRSHFTPMTTPTTNVGVMPGALNNGIAANGSYVPNTEVGGDVGAIVDWRYCPGAGPNRPFSLGPLPGNCPTTNDAPKVGLIGCRDIFGLLQSPQTCVPDQGR